MCLCQSALIDCGSPVKSNQNQYSTDYSYGCGSFCVADTWGRIVWRSVNNYDIISVYYPGKLTFITWI